MACLAVGVSQAVAVDDRPGLEEPFEITADRIDYDAERELYTADGHVRVVQGDRSLKARWITFSTATRIGVAEGDVVLLDGGDELLAQFMVFDVDSLQGMLYQGVLDSGSEGFHIEAEELVRTGKNTFAVRDGVFSTCRCEEGKRLPWQIHSKTAHVELGGYGTVRNATFEVLGVPVLWFPWAFFPVKNDRETGFLLPDFAFGGRGGASVGLPFFWAALPELNVTLTPRYFVDRGYKQDVELEYVLGRRSGGSLFVAGLDDQSADQKTNYRPERWAVRWENDLFLPAEWRWGTDLNLVSDNAYPSDFTEMQRYQAFRFLESTTNVARDFGASGAWGAMVAMRFADDLQGSTFDDSDDYVLQRWTEARGDLQAGSLVGPLGIEARINSELIYFRGLRSTESGLDGLDPPAPPPTRTDGRFYDIGVDRQVDNALVGGEGNGLYDPGEPLGERGSRLIIHPRLARPMALGGIVEFVPEIGWQQTLYQANTQKFAERGLLTARADFRGRLARDFETPSGWGMRHVVEPRLGWALVSQRRQRSNPLFVPRGTVQQSRLLVLALDNVTRNLTDRIESTNQLVFAVSQRFFTRPRRGSLPRMRVDLVTAVDWQFSGGSGLGNLTLDARLFPSRLIGGRLRGSFNPQSVAVREGEAELVLNVPVSNAFVERLELVGRYRYLRRLPFFIEADRQSPTVESAGDSVLNQIDLTARIELFSRFRLSYSTIYSLDADSGAIRNQGLVEYVSGCRCWGVGVYVEEQRRQGWRGGFSIRFLGLGDEQGSLFGSGFGAGVGI
jgi:LPS-assembly protein